jgi:hypothetical protein
MVVIWLVYCSIQVIVRHKMEIENLPMERLLISRADHRSKQGGQALSISDHMCQRWGGVVPNFSVKG